MTTLIKFNDSELALLANALWCASEEYKRIAKEHASDKRFAAQFEKQAADALKLREKIESAEPPLRIRAICDGRVQAYLRNGEKGWQCLLPNGVGVDFSYAGLQPVTEVGFALADAGNDEADALAVCRKFCLRHWTYETWAE